MSKKSCLALLILFLSPVSTLPGLAQADRDSSADPIMKMEAAGWKIVQDGVLRRELRPNQTETFVFGVEGFTWKLRDLRSQLQVLRREFKAHPTPELRRAIASHRKAIASTVEMIERARTAEASGETGIPKTGCTLSFHYNAAASYKTDRQGTWAEASADFNASPECNFSGEVYAYAFAKTTVNGAPTTATVTDGPRSGSNVSAAADANRNGGSVCESYGYASVTSNNLNPSSYSKSQSNALCPSPPPPSSLQVSVTSDNDYYIEIWEDECVLINWTANISGGSGYTSKIYRNDVLQLTGTTYSEEICWEYPDPTDFDITIRADVLHNGQIYSASHTTTIHVKFWIYSN